IVPSSAAVTTAQRVLPAGRSLRAPMLSQHQIRVIYNEGVEAVAQTIRQLSGMIETEDERVQKLIAHATSMHLKKIEQLNLRINHLEEELARRGREVRRLELLVKTLNKELKEARAQTRLAREAHLA